MATRRSRRRWEGRDSQHGEEDDDAREAAASVRDLESWSPQVSGRLKAPPTGRLLLELDGVGHGKTAQQQQDYARLKKEAAERRRSASTAASSSMSSSAAATAAAGGAAEATVPLSSCRPQEHDDVIVSDIRRSEDLRKHEKSRLKAQLKVLDRLSARCKGPADQAREVLALFRRCEPDEFGFVSREHFLKRVISDFQLKPREAETIFRLGTKHIEATPSGRAQPSSQEPDELNYLQFREAFKRLDRSKTFKPAPFRPMLNRDAAPKYTPMNDSGKAQRFTSMSKDARSEYRQRNRVLGALDRFGRKVEARFRQRAEASSAEGKEVQVRTRLGFDEVAKVLAEFDVPMGPATVRRLYQREAGESGLTFSQLYRRNDQYFSDLQGEEGPDTASRNMELRGEFLGCRRRGEQRDKETAQVAQDGGPSGFLAHHATPRPIDRAEGTTKCVQSPSARQRRKSERRRRRRNKGDRLPGLPEAAKHDTSARDCLDMSSRFEHDKQHLWKARWLDKTLPRKARRGQRAHVAEISGKMNEGNGAIIRMDDVLEDPHPLATGRSSLYSARSDMSYDTERSERLTGRSELSRSFSALDPPFGTDRDNDR